MINEIVDLQTRFIDSHIIATNNWSFFMQDCTTMSCCKPILTFCSLIIQCDSMFQFSWERRAFHGKLANDKDNRQLLLRTHCQQFYIYGSNLDISVRLQQWPQILNCRKTNSSITSTNVMESNSQKTFNKRLSFTQQHEH